MLRATTDRGEVIHFAGFHHLSPGLDPMSRPAFSSATGDGVTRCGWETFFTALSKGGLAVAFEQEDPGSVRFVPEAEARGGREHADLRAALLHSKRFWRALRGGGTSTPP